MSNADLIALSATAAVTEIARGAVSSEDYVRACLARIAEVEPEIKAFAHLDPDHALAQARGLDERRLEGQPIGPLHGIPVGIKDIIDTRDYPTECGSPFLAGRRPMRDATVVEKLRVAGAVIIGKTVTTELAYFHPGKTRNPHDVERTPGGSSSGSAAAVAAGMVPLAIGSQTNGSIIRPASFCGVYAAKPSHGLVSRFGVLSLSQVLDHVGPFARNLSDLALILDVIAGYDAADTDTRPVAMPNVRQVAFENFPVTPRFAFIRTPIWGKADASARSAFEQLAEKLGDACIAIDLPENFAEARDALRVIMAADMAHRFGPMADRGGDAVSAVMQDLIVEGRKVGATRYLQALDQAKAFGASLNAVFEECNAIITPATIGVAPKGLDSTGSPLFCSLWTLSGLPALSLPLLEGDDGMPLGVQLIGARNDDARLLRHANWLVSALAPKSKRRSAKAR